MRRKQLNHFIFYQAKQEEVAKQATSAKLRRTKTMVATLKESKAIIGKSPSKKRSAKAKGKK